MPWWLDELLKPDRLISIAAVPALLWLLGRLLTKNWGFIAAFVGLVQVLVGDEDKGQPGIAARMDAQAASLSELGEKLETVRAQVQNSHHTNLRDDVDVIRSRLDEHIAIAKESDRRQDKTAEEVAIMRRDIGRIVAKYVP